MLSLSLWDFTMDLHSCHFVRNMLSPLIFHVFFSVGVVGSTMTSLLKGRDLVTTVYWKELKYDDPPEEFQFHVPKETDEEKKKNLMAALSCDEEEAEKIQGQLLPALALSSKATHL